MPRPVSLTSSAEMSTSRGCSAPWTMPTTAAKSSAPASCVTMRSASPAGAGPCSRTTVSSESAATKSCARYADACTMPGGQRRGDRRVGQVGSDQLLEFGDELVRRARAARSRRNSLTATSLSCRDRTRERPDRARPRQSDEERGTDRRRQEARSRQRPCAVKYSSGDRRRTPRRS